MNRPDGGPALGGRERRIYISGLTLGIAFLCVSMTVYDTSPWWPAGLVLTGLTFLLALWMHTNWGEPTL